jgi:hypothetical protein
VVGCVAFTVGAAAGVLAVTVCVGPGTVAVTVAVGPGSQAVLVAVTVAVGPATVTVAVAVAVARMVLVTVAPGRKTFVSDVCAVALLGANRPPAIARRLATKATTAVRAVMAARLLLAAVER